MLASQEIEHFFNSCTEIESVQTAILLQTVIHPNRDCEFGKEYEFDDINSLTEFRRQVPLSKYEDIRDYVDRMANGEKNILSSQRILAFFKTSGSLAAPKLIPVTASFVIEKSRAFGIFWNLVYKEHSSLKSGKMIANFSDSGAIERSPGGIEVLSEATFWNRRAQSVQRQTRSRWPIPAELREVIDPHNRHYAAARLTLQDSLNGIMCLNPSTLLLFCRTIEQYLEQLIAGIYDGSWGRSDKSFTNDVSAELSNYLIADKERARFLEQASKCLSSKSALKALWPELDLTICWRSELVQPYYRQLEPYLENISARDYITQSSECIMAIPVQDQTSGGLLAYTSHFFEFIPESQISNDEPETYFAWELEQNKIYELVVTTSGGFYRYRMGDCIRVVSFEGKVPLIEFLYRAGKTSSMTGEKLTEYQIIQTARRTQQQCDYSPNKFLCFPRSGTNPHYGVLIEWDNSANNFDKTTVVHWLRTFDSELKKINSEYADKCSSGRLGDIAGILLDKGGFEHYRQLRKASGISDEQFKEEILSSRLDIDRELPVLDVINVH